MATDCQKNKVAIIQKLQQKCDTIQTSTSDVSALEEERDEYIKEKRKFDKEASQATNYDTRTIQSGYLFWRKKGVNSFRTGNKDRLTASAEKYKKLIGILDEQIAEREKRFANKMDKQEKRARQLAKIAEQNTDEMKKSLEKQQKEWEEELRTIQATLDKLDKTKKKTTEKYNNDREKLYSLQKEKAKAQEVVEKWEKDKDDELQKKEKELKDKKKELEKMRDKYKMSGAGLMEFFKSASKLGLICQDTMTDSISIKQSLTNMAKGFSSTQPLTFSEATAILGDSKIASPKFVKTLKENGFKYCRDLACDDDDEFDEFILGKLNKEAEGFKDEFGSDKRLMKKFEAFCVKKPYEAIEKDNVDAITKELKKNLPSLSEFFMLYHSKSMIAMRILTEKKVFDKQQKLEFINRQKALVQRASEQASSDPRTNEATVEEVDDGKEN